MEHLRRATGRTGCVVTGLDQRNLQPAGGRIEGRSDTDDTTAHHDDVELLGLKLFPSSFALLRAEKLRTLLLTQPGLL